MDDYLLVGKIINTFGIKGELKTISEFEYKDRIFKKNFVIYIGEEKIKEVINSYRSHQIYDLITLNNYQNINEILKYKNKYIYIKRSDLELKDQEYLLDDLIGYKVYDDDKLLGVVVDYVKTKEYYLIEVKGDKRFYLPNIPHFIKKVDKNVQRIMTNKGSELIL